MVMAETIQFEKPNYYSSYGGSIITLPESTSNMNREGLALKDGAYRGTFDRQKDLSYTRQLFEAGNVNDDMFENFFNFVERAFGEGPYNAEQEQEIEILKDMWLFSGNPAINISSKEDRDIYGYEGSYYQEGRPTYNFYSPERLDDALYEENVSGGKTLHSITIHDEGNTDLKDQFLAEIAHGIQYFQGDSEMYELQSRTDRSSAELRSWANDILNNLGFNVADLDKEWRYEVGGSMEHQAHLGHEDHFHGGGIDDLLQDYIDEYKDPNKNYLIDIEEFGSGHALAGVIEGVDLNPSYLDLAKSYFNILTTGVDEVALQKEVATGHRRISRNVPGHGLLEGVFGPEWSDEDIDMYFKTYEK
tara:strand:- start:10048 stop:11130 length:1083 start_codon:yes stop_codon:yes gene_type:complete